MKKIRNITAIFSADWRRSSFLCPFHFWIPAYRTDLDHDRLYPGAGRRLYHGPPGVCAHRRAFRPCVHVEGVCFLCRSGRRDLFPDHERAASREHPAERGRASPLWFDRGISVPDREAESPSSVRDHSRDFGRPYGTYVSRISVHADFISRRKKVSAASASGRKT